MHRVVSVGALGDATSQQSVLFNLDHLVASLVRCGRDLKTVLASDELWDALWDATTQLYHGCVRARWRRGGARSALPACAQPWASPSSLFGWRPRAFADSLASSTRSDPEK